MQFTWKCLSFKKAICLTWHSGEFVCLESTKTMRWGEYIQTQIQVLYPQKLHRFDFLQQFLPLLTYRKYCQSNPCSFPRLYSTPQDPLFSAPALQTSIQTKHTQALILFPLYVFPYITEHLPLNSTCLSPPAAAVLQQLCTHAVSEREQRQHRVFLQSQRNTTLICILQ